MIDRWFTATYVEIYSPDAPLVIYQDEQGQVITLLNGEREAVGKNLQLGFAAPGVVVVRYRLPNNSWRIQAFSSPFCAEFVDPDNLLVTGGR